jgi:uncharacterized lipoprotein YbaY
MICQVLLIPENQVICQLADRVVSLAVAPARLLGSQPFHRDIRGHKPFLTGMRGSQFRKQHFAK